MPELIQTTAAGRTRVTDSRISDNEPTDGRTDGRGRRRQIRGASDWLRVWRAGGVHGSALSDSEPAGRREIDRADRSTLADIGLTIVHASSTLTDNNTATGRQKTRRHR